MSNELQISIEEVDAGLSDITITHYFDHFFGVTQTEVLKAAVRDLSTDVTGDALTSSDATDLLRTFGDVSRTLITFKGAIGFKLGRAETDREKLFSVLRPQITDDRHSATGKWPVKDWIQDVVNQNEEVISLTEIINLLKPIHTMLSEWVDLARRRESILTQLAKNVREE